MPFTGKAKQKPHIFCLLSIVGEWQVSQSRTVASLEDKAAGQDLRAVWGVGGG